MKPILIFTLIIASIPPLLAQDLASPIIGEDVVFNVVDGTVAVEAEYFYKQSHSDIRQWYRTSKDAFPDAGRDEDPPHLTGASNGAYLEILPDTRVTHEDTLISGENFSNEPGKLAVLHYKIHFNKPGKYYVWVRAFSTGSEDNGVHVGLDGRWPESGRRLQWCEGKESWYWESKQRTEEVHCGEPYKIFLEIDKPGLHEIMFSLREDGFEFDKFVITQEMDPAYGTGCGPEVLVKSGISLPVF